MKLFDPRAALAKIEKQGSPPATSATSATLDVQTTSQVAKVAEVAAPSAEILNFAPDQQKAPVASQSNDYRHGTTFDGTPKTWTGKVVPLDAWRQLSEWEKHGPDGRHWNGKTQSWEIAE